MSKPTPPPFSSKKGGSDKRGPSDKRASLLADAERQSKRDRTRLIVMGVGLVLVVGAYFATTLQGERHRAEEQATLDVETEAPFIETLWVEDFDLAAVEGQFADARPEDRVLLPSALTQPFTDYVRGKTAVHFNALGLEVLDAGTREGLFADPASHRARPFRARGELQDIEARQRPDGSTEHRGWLRDEDGQAVHFIVLDVPQTGAEGFVRIDGLFVKLYREEVNGGEWVEGPLLVGAELVPSYPLTDLDALTPLVLLDHLGRIQDDKAMQSTGLDGFVMRAQWALMDFAKTEAYAAIDWENDAVELNNVTMTSLLSDGEAWRYRLAANGGEDPRGEPDVNGERRPLTEDLVPVPIRIPICKNMGTSTLDPGENPARMETITTGWIGNWTWNNQAGVLKFVMPGEHPELLDWKGGARLVEGKGFFLKNHNYESKDHGTRTAPYFVVTELVPFVPVEDTLAQELMWGVLGLTLLLVIAFPLLLLRDRKKSRQLQQDLVRRRQERRRRLAAEQPQT